MIQCLCSTGSTSPLDAARQNGHKAVVKLLEAAGFTQNHIFGQSPMYLTFSGRPDEVMGQKKEMRQKKEKKGKSKVSEFNSEEISGHRSDDLDSVLQVFSQGIVLICNVDAV